jgi:hypothetical protein
MMRTPGASTTGFYLAPSGVNSGAMRLPARDEDEEADAKKAPGFGPNDHLVEPETRQEMFRGQIVDVQPARPGHADLHSRLNKVLDHHAVDGYASSSDLLTRRSMNSDFATDASVRRLETNPATGQRYVEELSFEIFFKQSREYACERARDVIGSGVRRLFGIFVKERWPGSDDNRVIDWTVAEWSSERDDWVYLSPGHVITDPCLRIPLPVEALVEALASDNAAQRALRAKRNPELQEYLAQVRREDIFDVLEQRRIMLDELQRARIEACDDLAILKRWHTRAMHVASAAELLD